MWPVFVHQGADVVDGFVDGGPLGADAGEVGADGGQSHSHAVGGGGEGAAGAVQVESALPAVTVRAGRR